MNIKKIKISDIEPADYNPRQIDDTNKENLKKSIEEFGLVDPIIINLKNNNIIGGHQRFDYLHNQDKNAELHLLELGDIGWVFSDTDLKIKDNEHEKALNLALNRISGEWNINALNNILDELKEFKLDGLTGFDYNLDDFDYEFVPLDDMDEDYEEYEFIEDLNDDLNSDDENDFDLDDLSEKTIEKAVPKQTSKKKTEKDTKNLKGAIIILNELDNGSSKSNQIHITTSEKLIKLIQNKTKRIG